MVTYVPFLASHGTTVRPTGGARRSLRGPTSDGGSDGSLRGQRAAQRRLHCFPNQAMRLSKKEDQIIKDKLNSLNARKSKCKVTACVEVSARMECSATRDTRELHRRRPCGPTWSPAVPDGWGARRAAGSGVSLTCLPQIGRCLPVAQRCGRAEQGGSQSESPAHLFVARPFG